ncbi:MAG: hypothetical protein A3E38_02090 [Candidatus Moranbacteria bacterium RIFCSPHIGHO2_12_FULL_54_9]|nr:MAG: hypothetical protein A2878_00030 [Candidatus Moranbacteria bacterium RIFCSPHIGHO2_01_FULL_54_31]OGI26258.1 MAG: hypothetical protein A3E38_02090 [Candidatus Moranbacteria bacterium RIFCSPHIGHO2_12_FULL_54_9]
MFRKTGLVIISAFLLSGCSLSVPSGLGTAGGSIWKSFDGGATFAPKTFVNDKQSIGSADVLSFVFDPRDPQIIYIGTKDSGIFKTTDGAEHWEQITFPPLKVYGLAIDHSNGDRLYASGVYNEISKMYRTDDAGKNWKEIYTEPGKGTVITTIGSNPDTPNVLYAGTSAGVVIKSVDSGDSWKNISIAKGPVTGVFFDSGAPNLVRLFIFGQGMAVSNDGGQGWDDYTSQKLAGFGTSASPKSITAVIADPVYPGLLYAGAQNGLFRSRDGGKAWEAINIIESSRKFPIRAIAINPHSSEEIAYAAGAAFYKSSDGGVNWATTQLEINRGISFIHYDPSDPARIYFTLRKF